LVFNVIGLGVKNTGMNLQDSVGTNICSKVKIEKYSEVQCLTKRNMVIDNNELIESEYQKLDDKVFSALNTAREKP